MIKMMLLLPLTMLILVFSGCSNNTDGSNTPLLLLPYTPRGESGTADLLIKATYDTSETEENGDPVYGGAWYGVSIDLTDDDGTPPYVPIEEYLPVKETPVEVDSLKVMVKIDNNRIAENHWSYRDSSTFDDSKNLVEIGDLPIGFHHLDIYIPGFSVMSRDINIVDGQNYLELVATPPEKKTESYFPFISGLIFNPSDSTLSFETKRFMNFPIKIYLGKFVESDFSTGGSGEIIINGYSEITNEASLMSDLEIDTPPEEVLNECHSNAIWALNQWGNACSKLSYIYTSDPSSADISVYWTNDSQLLGNTDGTLGVTYNNDMNYGTYSSLYSFKPVVFLSLRDPVKGTGLMNELIRKHTYLHEFGHALGLWGHSPYESDIMYAYEPRGAMNYYIEEPKLSERDINSINQLYELTPVFTNLPNNNYLKPEKNQDFWPEWIN